MLRIEESPTNDDGDGQNDLLSEPKQLEEMDSSMEDLMKNSHNENSNAIVNEDIAKYMGTFGNMNYNEEGGITTTTIGQITFTDQTRRLETTVEEQVAVEFQDDSFVI